MGRVHYKEEQIIANLRKAELLFAEGKSKTQVCKALGVTPVTFTRWKNKQARILKYFCKTIGLPEIRFHTLRACFATQLIGSGVAPVKVMKISGWKDLKTLAVYLRLAGIDERGATDVLRFLPE
ncbi:MAG: tyrosine-type recombinase/integrase [Bacteriovoracaceae bacterium]|nr:tyrosine-type recombinase/integrase [Bacteriovoracaceae bacterium]